METIVEVLLWLYVLDLSLVLGAGLYEARIEVPRWLARGGGTWHWDRAAAVRADVGLRFWVYASTFPLTLLTLGSALVLAGTPPPVRLVWAGSVAVVVLERVATFGYFIPTMIRLTRAAPRPDDAAVARRWVRCNHARHVANLVAWVLAVQAFAAWARTGG